jgi:AcrR family transcriptional regulator
VDLRPTRPALAERYDRRQQNLVVVSAHVFAERGYEQTSVQELTAELGMTPAALYHYFPSKDELLLRICDELVEPLLQKVKDAVVAGDSPAAQLRTVVRIWVAHVVEHRDHMLVFQQQRHTIERAELWSGVRVSRKRFERFIADLIRAVDRCGQLRSSDQRIALAALLGMVNHTAQWYAPAGRLRPETIADGYVDLIAAG